MSFATGWFGIPGGPEGGKTHVVRDEKPICGTKPPAGAVFMFCAAGIYAPFVECLRCIRALATPPATEEAK